MAAPQPQSSSFRVYTRWRPPIGNESSLSEMECRVEQHGTNHSISLASQSNSKRPRTWKSGPSFARVFPADAVNADIFEGVVAPTLPRVMNGATCKFFAYGHSGSGKTHTIIGYNYEDDQHLGLYLSSARNLFRAIAEIKNGLEPSQADDDLDKEALGIAVRLYEVRGKYAYDLFNNGTECHVRQGYDGRTYIRGQTEMLEGGKVRVRPIVAIPCWSYDELRRVVLDGVEKRKNGSSTVHDESSRTHAFLELEIITKALLEARDAVIERESELVPVGKRATDIYLEEHKRTLIRTPEGMLIPDPNVPLNQERIDAAEVEKRECEARVKEAEDAVADYLKGRRQPCLGGKFVFVDLAGSEYFDQGAGISGGTTKQTSQERQQGRQINTDLFALKEVIRARASNQARLPFRSSPLTMVLRDYFLATDDEESAMILTVSPCESQIAATMNTLKYGNLVGDAGGSTKN
ncbi:kinesin family member 2/24 [Periconia macrospinosa]|uniref:Kinesin-like protein n=1 Tax=Periconia macrospinosa TaxID=97972 RepID=A0A2V1D8N2_9PLEO|nr:kinesin family member 2/24 [Periconia macrospinosa]